MILGAAAWGLRETPLKEQLAMIKRIGVRELELSIAGHENDTLQIGCSVDEIKSVKALFAANDVSLIAAATGNDFTQANADLCKDDLKKLEQVIEIAGELGIRYLRVFAGFSPARDVTAKRWDTMIDCLCAANETAQKHNVQLAVETHGGVEEIEDGIRHFLSTSSQPDLLDKMLAELPDEIGLVFDPANLGAVGLSTAQVIDLYHKYQKRICYLHLKDFRKVTATAILPCACGEGQLNWNELSQGLSGFSGYGFIEYELPEDVEEGMVRSLNALQGKSDARVGN